MSNPPALSTRNATLAAQPKRLEVTVDRVASGAQSSDGTTAHTDVVHAETEAFQSLSGEDIDVGASGSVGRGSMQMLQYLYMYV